MNPLRTIIPTLLALVLVVTPSTVTRAQDSAEAAPSKPALTYQRHPVRFDSQNPLTPESPILLRFNQPVDVDDAAEFLQLYDKPNERFAAIRVERPDRNAIAALGAERTEGAPADRFVLVRPRTSLPLGGTWYLHARAGLASADGSHEIADSRLDYIGSLYAFEINEIEAVNQYDQPLAIRIGHNKNELAPAFDAARVGDFISVSPSPPNLDIAVENYHFLLRGEFDYGIAYRVTISDGLLAHDRTQLAQVVTDTIEFRPDEGFISLPAFTTTQNAAGHRRFDIRSGNLTGVRTRVKRLADDDLVLALREYEKNYQGSGEEQTLPFTTVPGRTIYDQFRPASAGVDETEKVSLSWGEIAGEADTGAFYLCAEGQSATRDDLDVGAQSLIQLTDIGLTWKQSVDDTLLYAFSLESGAPLPEASVRLVDETAAPLAETTTGADGATRIDADHYAGREDRLYLDVRHDGDRHVIAFSENLNTLGLWSFSIRQRYDDPLDGERRTLLFTDRNVYQPGDEVKIKALSRFVDTRRLLGPGSGRATLRVYDPRRRKLVEREVEFDRRGSFDDSFTLPGAGLGWHSVELDFNPPEAEHPDWRLITNHSFQVEEYRVNTFEVNIEPADHYDPGEIIEVPVSARYYMGKPLSKAELKWNAYANVRFPRPRGFDEFDFGDRTADRTSFSVDGATPLSGKGAATISFELPERPMNPGPRRVTVIGSVTDANQQTIGQTENFTVHSSDFYLGLRQPDGVHRAGDTPTFSIAAVTPEGEAHTEPVETTLLVEKEIWNTVKVVGANGQVTHRNDRRLRTVSEETFTLETGVNAETGLTRAVPRRLTFEEPGDYLVTLTARDAQDRPVLTRARFTVIGAEEPSWSWHDVIRIDVIPDREQYRVGDTAKLLVRSPVFGHALLTTERGGVRTSRTLEIDQYETVVEIPIEEGAAPNLFASVLVIRGSGDSPHAHPSTDYRLGYCQLEVEDPTSRLSVTLDTGERDYFEPGEPVEVAANLTDASGEPVAGAEVTLFAVDEGVLSLTNHETPDPHGLFHDIFPLAVRTGQSLRDLLPENPREQDFGNKGYVIGGGGGLMDGLDPDRIREDFEALTLWEPSLVTDENGRVTARFEAPDNLTTFRLMAVAARDNRFGSAEAPIVINKPLIIEPALPTHTNLGDQIDVSAVLHNNSGELQEVEIEVNLDEHGIFLSGIGETVPTSLPEDAGERVRTARAVLEAGATETVSFPVALTATGDAEWTWRVQSLGDEGPAGEGLDDATRSTTEVGYPLPLLRENHSFTLRDGQSLDDALQAVAPRLREGRGSVEVTLSNSRLVEAADGIDYLLQYPYGCVEQTTSALIPWLTSNQLRPVVPQLDTSPEEADETIRESLDRLFSMQTGDGGLGYWPGDSKSVLWGSAWGGVAIALARQQGIKVPEPQAGDLWKYLAKNLRNSHELEDAYELSQRCLAAWALALADVNETAYHEMLYGKRRQLSAEARSLLALAMLESGTDTPERIRTLLSPDPEAPVAEVSWYRQPYIVATRLLAVLRHDPRSARVDELVDDLMRLRNPRNGWGNTYSNAWPLIALAADGERAAENLSANEIEVAFAGETTPVELPDQPGSETLAFEFDGAIGADALRLAPSGDGPVHATVRIATRPELMVVEPENEGFAISRRYRKVAPDGAIGPAEDLRVGDLILVTLDLNVPTERETYLAIDDPLPALFEAVNPKFESQATQRINRERDRRILYANHREMRRDRVLFFADSVFRAGDYSLQYLARVVAPGEVTAPPAKIEAMYEPRRFGLTGAERIAAAPLPVDSDEVAAR